MTPGLDPRVLSLGVDDCAVFDMLDEDDRPVGCLTVRREAEQGWAVWLGDHTGPDPAAEGQVVLVREGDAGPDDPDAQWLTYWVGHASREVDLLDRCDALGWRHAMAAAIDCVSDSFVR